ncbi:MAG TPA: hypothetical protein EYQ83_08195 [Acidobacteria bacterium]|nr:hypothetical protein [Acidobacteriota bacterium]
MHGPPGSSGNFTEAWLGSRSDRAEVAARVSPLTYVRSDMPPVLTIHGDADPIVPYDHAVRLHRALDGARVPNQLVTVPGGGHGGFSRDESVRIYETIRAFLREHRSCSRLDRAACAQRSARARTPASWPRGTILFSSAPPLDGSMSWRRARRAAISAWSPGHICDWPDGVGWSTRRRHETEPESLAQPHRVT